MKNRSIRPHRGIRNSRADRVFYGVNGVLMALTFLLYAWPLWFVLIASFSDPNLVQAGQVLLLPKGFHLGGYKLILEYQDILRGYLNSILYTVVGTALNLVMTICAAYPLSRSDFLPRKVLTVLFVFTMYFSGGLIPLFFVVKHVGIYNTRWANFLPYLVSTYNVIIMRSFFASLPESLEEAALIDGANEGQILRHVILPLSKPVLAVIALYYAVGHWNSWFPSMVFIRNTKLYTLQYVLRGILITNSTSVASGDNVLSVQEISFASELVKYCTIVISTLPIMCVYPFLTKYFEKGVMIGAVKG